MLSSRDSGTLAEQDLGKFLVFKIGVLFTTLFLFFTTTTLVSFTLRETQVKRGRGSAAIG